MGLFNWFKRKDWESLCLDKSWTEVEEILKLRSDKIKIKTEDYNYHCLSYVEIINLCIKAVCYPKQYIPELYDCENIVRRALSDIDIYWAFYTNAKLPLAVGKAEIDRDGKVHKVIFFLSNQNEIIFYDPQNGTFYIDDSVKVYEFRI